MRIIDTPKALLVEVPEGSWNHELYQRGNEMNLACFTAINEKGKVRVWESKYFPAYFYGQPILAAKMSEPPGELQEHNMKPNTTVVIPIN